jgi:EmrB/QacA subfamily drug resistance transporter
VTSAPTTADDRLTPELLRLAGVVVLGALMIQLDATMVNVALDTFRREFHASVSTIQWVSTAYLLALSMTIPLTGWSVQRFGAKRMWMTCLALFLAGSILCGLAWSAPSLILFRVLQGVGGGMMLPLAQTILAQAAGPRRLGRVMGLVGLSALLGPVLGPVLGGVLVTDASWRWIFYVNVPVCAVAMLAAWRELPDARAEGRSKLDTRGLVLLSPGLAAIVYGLSEAGNRGSFGDLRALVPMLAGAALAVAFAVHALRVRRPLIDVRLFSVRTFATSSTVLFLFGMAMFGTMLLLPLYLQQVRGEDALHAGLLLAPQGVGMGIALAVAGRLSDRMAPRPIVLIGLALTALGTFGYTQVGAHTSLLFVVAALVVSGAGLGAALVPTMASAIRDLDHDDIPAGSSATRIFMQVGGSFGAAILAVVLQRSIAGHGGGVAELASSYGHTFWWAFGLIGLALLPTLLLPGRASRTRKVVGTPAADEL